jgi:predicted DNA-binding transcriptional regulator AlpA
VTGEALLVIADLVAHFRMARSSIYAAIARGDLPKPIRIGRTARWRPADIAAAEARLAGGGVVELGVADAVR